MEDNVQNLKLESNEKKLKLVEQIYRLPKQEGEA